MGRCQKKWVFFSLILIVGFALSASAEMKRLSEFQNGIFHLSPKYYPDAAFDKSDQYIDDNQAEIFIAAAAVDIYLPADRDNYPFSLVDHRVLDSDLVIAIRGGCITRPYPRVLYLSRDNVSLADYTDIKWPPPVFQTKIKARDPFYHREVEAVAWQYNHSRIYQNEVIHYSVTPGENCIRGYLIDGEVDVRTGGVAVWKGYHPLPYSCPPPRKNPYTGTCSTCP